MRGHTDLAGAEQVATTLSEDEAAEVRKAIEAKKVAGYVESLKEPQP